MVLPYLAMKCVLEHMEANRRYAVASRCPFLRSIHKSTPLHVDYLALKENSITLNQHRYIFHTMFQSDPAGMELSFDINEYGTMDQELDMEESDVRIVNPDPDAGIRRRGSISDLVPYIRCTIEGLSGGPSAGYVRYPVGNKIRNAVRKHLGNLLNEKTFIKELNIDISHGILRIPAGLQFRVQKLVLKSDPIEILTPLLHSESFPLKSLTIRIYDPPVTLQNEILKNSESLVLFIKHKDNWNADVAKLTNKSILLIAKVRPTVPSVDIIRNWMNNPRIIGSKIMFQQRDAMETFKRLRTEIGAQMAKIPSRDPGFQYGATISIDATRELNMYGYPAPDHQKQSANRLGQPWMVVLEMMEKGSAIPL